MFRRLARKESPIPPAEDLEFPHGHFHSPVPSRDEVRSRQAVLFESSLRELPGIDLRIDAQLALLERLAVHYLEQPFTDEPTDARRAAGLRYYFRNVYYSYSDALFLYSFIRTLEPKRIIEIGSGFSSFVMIDTNELFFERSIQTTFIEPFPDRLRSRLTVEDLENITIFAQPVQDVALTLFEQLEANDILFVDSSHVSKVGSDVNHILFEILPRLKPGVFVHFHDVFWPFEYPREWIESGRFWNENYSLRAFLQFNTAFEIVLWNQFLALFFHSQLEERMPLALHNPGGSLWLRKCT